MIKAPFTPEQVEALNNWQKAGIYHPYICGNEQCCQDLIATEQGWTCPCCDYKQNWAHNVAVKSSTQEETNIKEEREIYFRALKFVLAISRLNASVINPNWHKMFEQVRERAERALEEGWQLRPDVGKELMERLHARKNKTTNS